MSEFTIYDDEELSVLEIIESLSNQLQYYKDNEVTIIDQLNLMVDNGNLTITDLNTIKEYFMSKIDEMSDLETSYLPELNLVKSQLAETMNKTAITLSHIFTDNTARDTYFTANPLEKINLTFIKVGTAYQQLINGVWTVANPIIVEQFNQIDDTSTAINKTLSASKVLELLTLKANKVQEEWITPTLVTGWTALDIAIYRVGYFKDAMGFVHVQVALKGGANQTIAFNLPVGYRPSKILVGAAIGASFTIARYQIDVNGNFTISGATVTTAFYTGEIIFRP